MSPAGQPGTLLTTCHANESGVDLHRNRIAR